MRPLVIIPDANAFARRVLVDRLIEEVELDNVRLYWSPKTIEEVGRLRLWIWIRRALRTSGLPEGSSAWKSVWAGYSDAAHRWFARISSVCQVIEDREPHDSAWSDPIPDPNDAWLWNSARRANADLVVTENLRDGPPVDPVGSRRHERIGYVHPRVLMLMLDVWRDVRASNAIPENLDEYVRQVAGTATAADITLIISEIRAVLARIAEESSARQS